MSARPAISPATPLATPLATSECGFTLVEVLISLFIFSLISVAGFIALSATLDARERAQARLDAMAPLAAMRRLLADDIDAMVPRDNRDGLGGRVDSFQTAYTPGTLDITRRARSNPGGEAARGDLLRLQWRVEVGQLIRAFLPHENPALVEPAQDRIVLDGVDAMSVALLFEGDVVLSDGGNPNGLGLHRAAEIARLQRGRMVALDIRLTHADGTTTRHVFAVPALG